MCLDIEHTPREVVNTIDYTNQLTANDTRHRQGFSNARFNTLLTHAAATTSRTTTTASMDMNILGNLDEPRRT